SRAAAFLGPPSALHHGLGAGDGAAARAESATRRDLPSGCERPRARGDLERRDAKAARAAVGRPADRGGGYSEHLTARPSASVGLWLDPGRLRDGLYVL